MADFDSPLARFFAASLALHLGAFLFLVYLSVPRHSFPQPDSIKVSLLPEPPPEQISPKDVPATRSGQFPKAAPKPPRTKQSKSAHVPAPTRAAKTPPIIAKKSSPPLPEKRAARNNGSNPSRDPVPVIGMNQPEPPPHRPVRERDVIVEHPLPTLKELLPPLTYSLHEGEGQEEGSVSLYTTDPKYITYVGKIRQSIESEWEYPEMALRYGLQGKLALEFTILSNGQLEGLRLLRTSGSSLLDNEALRAIKAAAPFPPIPPWIKPNPLRITATMEYRDSRLDYRFAR